MNTERLHSLALSDSGFIFDPTTGNSFTTNETGLFIINCLKRGDDVARIATTLVQEYDVDKANAEQDVFTIIELLRSHDLV
ncbi:MAG: PqqD family protein [Chitinivibrionales bacterium]|nr:PqqD family protein [Chitinivibrionales bacterium]